MTPPYDTTGLAPETLAYGTLYLIDAHTLYAKPHKGAGRVVRRDEHAHEKTLRRNAENHLLRVAGVEQLPRCCAVCGEDVLERRDNYCSYTCHAKRGGGRDLLARHATADLLPEDFEARFAVIRAKRDRREIDSPPRPAKDIYAAEYSGRDLHAGLLAAEALIRAKGGIVPVREDFWEYLDEYLAAQETVVSETA